MCIYIQYPCSVRRLSFIVIEYLVTRGGIENEGKKKELPVIIIALVWSISFAHILDFSLGVRGDD